MQNSTSYTTFHTSSRTKLCHVQSITQLTMHVGSRHATLELFSHAAWPMLFLCILHLNVSAFVLCAEWFFQIKKYFPHFFYRFNRTLHSFFIVVISLQKFFFSLFLCGILWFFLVVVDILWCMKTNTPSNSNFISICLQLEIKSTKYNKKIKKKSRKNHANRIMCSAFHRIGLSIKAPVVLDFSH